MNSLMSQTYTQKLGSPFALPLYTWEMAEEDESITAWIAQLQQGDEEAARQIVGPLLSSFVGSGKSSA